MTHPPLAPRTDIEALSARFRSTGRVIVPDLLAPDFAEELGRLLASWRKWTLVTRIGGQHRSFDAEASESIDAAGRAALDELVCAEARAGFQYLYDRYPLYDPEYLGCVDDPVLERMRNLLRADAFLELMRAITGRGEIGFADGQVTRYRGGHFLTRHDDADEGKHRLAAYVLGMTPDWRADYGGQLQFIAQDGGVEQAVVPGFNTLSLFEVPQPHLVTAVARFVERPRLSITGWLRHH